MTATATFTLPTPTATSTITLPTSTVTQTFVSTTIVPETTLAPFIPREVWVCEGVDCRIIGLDHSHDDGLSGGEIGLLIVLIIVGIIFVALLVLIAKIHLGMKEYANLNEEISNVGKTRQDVKNDVTQAGESLKDQDRKLDSNARELEHINGQAPPEGQSHHPAANQPLVPLRTTVHDFQTRLQHVCFFVL